MKEIYFKLLNLFDFRNYKKFKIFTKIFTVLILAFLLFCMVLICNHEGSDKLFFILMPLCFINSFFLINDPLILLGEFITIAGDVCLMLFHEDLPGFIIYVFVQFSYAFYFLLKQSKKTNIIISSLRIGLSIVGIIVLFIIFKNNIELKLIFGVIYYINLLINLVCAIIDKNIILILGLSFMAISDLVIALKLFVKEGSGLYEFLSSFNFIHFFYLPSQVLIMFNKKRIDYIKLFSKNDLEKESAQINL